MIRVGRYGRTCVLVSWGIGAGGEGMVRPLARSLARFPNPLPTTPTTKKTQTHTGRYSFACDAADDASIKTLLHSVHERFDRRPLHALLHSIAYASPQAMRGPFLRTGRADFVEAHALSSYSLVALAREAFPFMAARGGASVVGGWRGVGMGVGDCPFPRRRRRRRKGRRVGMVMVGGRSSRCRTWGRAG